MKNIFTVFIVILVSLSACRKDDHLIEIVPDPITTETTEESNLTGIVLDVDGNVLVDTEITLGNVVTTTDENGVYFITDAEISSTGSLVKSEKPGFIPQFRFAFNEPGQLSYLNIQMVPETFVAEFSSADGGTFLVQDKSSIKFSKNGVLNQDSSIYNGQVTLNAFWFDPTDERTIANMPGDLRGLDKDGEKVQLATQGMFSLNIYDQQGNELLVGDPVELSFYVGDKGVDVDGTGTMPLWSLDEETGEWIEEGSSILEGDYFVGEVSHFSFWNCDFPFPLTCISGIITDVNGDFIPNAGIKIVEQNELTCGTGISNARGYFEAKVPAGTELVLYINGCNVGVDLGSLSGNTNNLGEIVTELITTSFTATLLDCGQTPISTAYAVVKVNDYRRVFYANSQGKVFGSIANCNLDDLTLSGYDFVGLIYSDDYTITSDISTQVIDVELCNELESYFEFEYNNDLTQIGGNEIDFIDVKLVQDDILVIKSSTGYPGTAFELVYPLTPEIPRSIFIINLPGAPVDVQDFVIDMVQSGTALDETFEGSFDGDSISFKFKLKLTDIRDAGSVIVKVWDDANQNGIQDVGELPVEGIRIYIEDAVIGGFGTNAYALKFETSDENGIVQYSGLLPNLDYQLTVRTVGSYWSTVSVTQAGLGSNDELDSDFIENDSQSSSSEVFFLPSGAIDTSYDLGLFNQ